MTTLSTKPATLNARHTTGPGPLPTGTTQQELRSVSAPLAGRRQQLPRHVVPGTCTSADDGHSLSWHAPDTLAHIGLDLCPPMAAPWLLGCPGTVWLRPS